MNICGGRFYFHFYFHFSLNVVSLNVFESGFEFEPRAYIKYHSNPRSMNATGGGPPRPPPSPSKAIVMDMFKESHSFNGVISGIESQIFKDVQLHGFGDSAMAGPSITVTDTGVVAADATEQETARPISSAPAAPPPPKRQKTTAESVLELQRQVLEKELKSLKKFDSVLDQAADFFLNGNIRGGRDAPVCIKTRVRLSGFVIVCY